MLNSKPINGKYAMNNNSCHSRQSSRFSFSILLIAILIASTAFSQGPPLPILDHNQIIICVNNIATRGEISVRGLTANFPWPILSTISVVDSVGDIIPGLADTLRWLRPDEIAENGEPVRQIWQPVLEYHEEDTLFPPDPDIYNQKPEPLFTEVRWTDPIPTSTMLIMDVSESMMRDIDNAKQGLCQYLDLFRPGLDRGGLVEFAGTVLDYVDMTSDTSILKNTIRSATLNPGTALYEGLMTGLNLIKSETGRRAIIVYTDGGNNVTPFSPQAVIDSARANNLPIYTIALGTNTEDDSLKKIADETSGLFFKALTAEEMKVIYGKLAVLMQNYYVMAHASTDPDYNRTWRSVDVTTNYQGESGRAIGRYYVPGPPPQLFTDLSVSLESKTDTTIFADGDYFHAVKPGEIFDYIIRFENFGPDRAENIRLTHILPDSVSFISASIPPQPGIEDSLVWTLPALMPGVKDSIIVNVKLGDKIPINLKEIISDATIYAPDDTSPENNNDSDTTRVLFPESPKKFDLAVMHTAATDTTIDIAGNNYDAVVQGESYDYRIKVFNNGPVPALNFTLWDVFPDSVTLTAFDIAPTRSGEDTLFWDFPFLEIGDSIIVTFQSQVDSRLPFLPFPLINTSGVNVLNDSLLENNVSITTVYGIARQKPLPPITDLSLALTSTTEKRITIGSKTWNAVMPGDTFQYHIDITNLGAHQADIVTITHAMHDSVHFISSSPAPKLIGENLLTWEFLNVQPSAKFTIPVTARLAESIPLDWDIITSQANLSSSNDTTLANNSDADTIKIIFEEPPPVKNFDLSMKQRVSRDTTITVGNKRFPAIFAENTYQYTLIITNSGPEAAIDFDVWDVFPDSAILSNFDHPVSRQTTDTLFWRINSLGAGDSATINFDALAAKSLPFYPYPLLNEAGIIASNDTMAQNNQDTTIVYVIKKSQISSLATDLEIKMASITDSTIIIDQETYNAVIPGENYKYHISVQNKGPYQADEVKLNHILPDSVKFISATVIPKSSADDSLAWEFDFIEPGKAVEIEISVKLSELVPNSLTELLSEAEIFARNDSTADNNRVDDIVKVKFQETPPLKQQLNLAIRQIAISDTGIVVTRNLVAATMRGGKYAYKIIVENFGPSDAKDFSVWEVPPDLATIVDHSLMPTKIVADTLFWQIDQLNVGEALTIDLEALAADDLPFTPYPLLNRAGLFAEQDTLADDNYSERVVYAIARPDDPRTMNADISVRQYFQTDSSVVVNNERIYYVKTGEQYIYDIEISNESQVAAENVILTDFIPDSVSTSSYQPQPNFESNDSTQWNLGYMLPQTKISLRLNVTVASNMQVGRNLLIHRVVASASNEDPARLSNNTSSTEVINLVRPAGGWQPLIQADPQKVKIGSNIKVRVQVTVPIESWDLFVYLADGQIDRNYADQFITATSLPPNQWTEVDPQYEVTRMYSQEKNEPLIFELRVVDAFGDFKTAQATVEIESENDFILDRNVFVPDQDPEGKLPITFKISAESQVRLEIFDITGTRISLILESQYSAGDYTYNWDGMTENGQKIGSGFYILTIQSGEYSAWKKLIIVR